MAARPWPLVTVDIDGTLTTRHGWLVIAEGLGRLAAFTRTQHRFFAREIGEDEHLHDMLEIASGAPLGQIESILARTPRIDGIPEGIELLRSRGSRVALLSHNPGYVCAWYQRTFGFDDFEGIAGPGIADGVVLPPGRIHADKAAGLKALCARAGVPPRAVVHLGDGWADAAVFPRVGAGVALNSRLPEVERAADLVLHSRNFVEVAGAVERLPPRP